MICSIFNKKEKGDENLMAKLYFRYGVMGSSKTANALMVHYNYKEKGQKALLVKSQIDTRDGELNIKSRVGIEHECVLFKDLASIDIRQYDCIIVDEAQFLTRQEVLKLVNIADKMDIPVICYGLRTDFKGKLFSGSKALFELADSIEEIKMICWCGKKAICNARFDESGTVTKSGKQVVLGANEQYTGLCRKHWMEGNLGDKGRTNK